MTLEIILIRQKVGRNYVEVFLQVVLVALCLIFSIGLAFALILSFIVGLFLRNMPHQRFIASATMIIAIGVGVGIFAGLLEASQYDSSRLFRSTPAHHQMFEKKEVSSEGGASRVLRIRRFGDLIQFCERSNIPQKMCAELASEKKVSIKMDHLGFRNNSEATRSKLVLIGDSFIWAESVDQSQTPASVFSRLMNAPVYGLGRGGIPDYIRIYSKLKDEFHARHISVVFIFEGNDYYCDKEMFYSRHSPFRYTPSIFSQTKLWNVSRILISQFAPQGYVVLEKLRGEPIGFYRPYVNNEIKAECNWGKLEIDSQRAAEVFDVAIIIPSKYRVYSTLLDRPVPLAPSRGRKIIASSFLSAGKKAISLESLFIEKAKEIIKDGALLYHRDDTHWNAIGIDTSARHIIESMTMH